MPKIERIAKEIEETEGFAVKIRAKSSGAKVLHPNYVYERVARASFTVADWRRRRFDSTYPDLVADVLFADGRAATSRASLRKVRESYN